MEINKWENSGLLEHLNEDEKLIIIDSFNRIEIHINKITEIAKPFIFPAIRRIYDEINKNFTGRNLFSLIDVDEFINSFNSFCNWYIDDAKKHLQFIDSEVSGLELFCHNYCIGLFKKSKYE